MIKVYWLEYTYYDHPGKYSLVLYTSGCNLRCFGCHNRTLSGRNYENENIETLKSGNIIHVNVDNYHKQISQEELKMSINNWMLDMVILCWWEFLIHNIDDIKQFIEHIKSINPNVLIRVDTNWTFPDKVDELINRWKVDGFAIDIKWPYWNKNYFETISKVIWIPMSAADSLFSKMTKSLNLSKQLPYTIYRTVSYPIVKDQNYFDEIKHYVHENLHKPHNFNLFVKL